MFGEIVIYNRRKLFVFIILCLVKLHILFTHQILKFQTESLSLILTYTFLEMSSWGSDCENDDFELVTLYAYY